MIVTVGGPAGAGGGAGAGEGFATGGVGAVGVAAPELEHAATEISERRMNNRNTPMPVLSEAPATLEARESKGRWRKPAGYYPLPYHTQMHYTETPKH